MQPWAQLYSEMYNSQHNCQSGHCQVSCNSTTEVFLTMEQPVTIIQSCNKWSLIAKGERRHSTVNTHHGIVSHYHHTVSRYHHDKAFDTCPQHRASLNYTWEAPRPLTCLRRHPPLHHYNTQITRHATRFTVGDKYNAVKTNTSNAGTSDTGIAAWRLPILLRHALS